jgi:hypothetical protein
MNDKKTWTSRFLIAKVSEKDREIIKHCKNKNVLDVGCVRQCALF